MVHGWPLGVQGLLHVPLVQMPVAHCRLLVQLPPVAIGATQVLCGPQMKPGEQFALLVQLVGQLWLVPLQA